MRKKGRQYPKFFLFLLSNYNDILFRHKCGSVFGFTSSIEVIYRKSFIMKIDLLCGVMIADIKNKFS